MTLEKLNKHDYFEWVNELKNKIQVTQLKASVAANRELTLLYWEFGKEIYIKQDELGWGKAVVESLAQDLLREFPDLKGFSRRNLFYMKSFYLFHKNNFSKVQQLVAQIPWDLTLITSTPIIAFSSTNRNIL